MTQNKTSQAMIELRLDAERNEHTGYSMFSERKQDEILAVCQKYKRMEEAIGAALKHHEEVGLGDCECKKCLGLREALSFDPL